MFIQINANGVLSLEEKDQMKSFSVVELKDASEAELAESALSAIAFAAEDDHYWIDAQAVIELSSESETSQWAVGFWEMLAAVEPYGYFDQETNRVKAHVERKGAL
ncbi:MAG: hypothetical protein ACI9J2_001989 [Saprospiraceae bacterium]|jgi:hypothetical protein